MAFSDVLCGTAGDSGCLEHREVVAGLGLELEGHVLVVFGHDLAPEAPGFPGDALPPLLVGQPPLVLLLAVPPEADLPHDAFKQLLELEYSCVRVTITERLLCARGVLLVAGYCDKSGRKDPSAVLELRGPSYVGGFD